MKTCPACNGMGKRINRAYSQYFLCNECYGFGEVADNPFKQLEDIFETIPRFDWKELNNKTLTTRVTEEDGYICLAGQDRETGKVYVLYVGKKELEM